ncbi:MAG: hypothetical protein M3O24_02070 [Thermoproteota archaeon]|nr:hypothetical protein [Thermoproteota archaeon]
MTLEFHAIDLSKIDFSTLDYLIQTVKHGLAMVVIGGVVTDLLDWYKEEDKNKAIDFRKYYNQAYHFLKIGHLERVPKFLISMQDLEPSLLRELANLDNENRNFVLKQAVGRIFEDINSRLYHASISKLLEVELVD